ncbi:MAG: hypothetical protein ACI88H_001384 [Cocleimonas sp.]|jgi:hypothetical protein
MLTTDLSLGAAISEANYNVSTKGTLALINISAKNKPIGSLV